MSPFLELSLVFAIATLVALFMQRLKLPLLLGYVLTGMIVGPLVLGWLHEEGTIALFSKLGVTALLFIVGLNLNPKATKEVGRVAIIVGLGQLAITMALGFGIGIALGYGWLPAAYIGLAVAFSSTIIVLKALQDRRELGSLSGKITVGVLLVQDLVATIAMVLISASAAGGTLLSFMEVVIKLFAIGAALWFVARFILPRLTTMFAASQEFLLLFSVAWGMGVAAVFHLLGFSIEIGALAAGVALATSPYHLEISAKMKLLRDFFLVLFFVLLGAEVAFGNVGNLWLPVVVLSMFVLFVKPLIVMVLTGALGYRKNTSFYVSVPLAQISEFSLVLLVLGLELGHIPQDISSILTIVGLVTFTCSSLFINTLDPTYRKLKKWLGIFERKSLITEKRRHLEPEAVLFGAHRLGQDFIPLLEKRGGPYLVIDFNPQTIRELQERGISCLYGDAAENEVIDEFDIKKLQLVISTVPDFETNQFLLAKVRKKNQEALFLVMAQSAEEAMWLYREGADYVILPHYLGGNYAALLLERYGLDAERMAKEREKHLKHLETRLAS